MLAYLLANCFSALSNLSMKFFVNVGSIASDKVRFVKETLTGSISETFQPELFVVIFHTNLINMFLYSIIHIILEKNNKIKFSLKETFLNKEEILQILLFSIPILTSSYKLFLAEKMDFTRIEISAMIKPFCVCALAILFLKEKIYSFYIWFATSAVIGFIIANYSKLHTERIWLLISYIIIASIGDVTRRYYCRKKSDAMQACCVEFTIYFLYGFLFLIIFNKFSLKILFNPYTWIISFLTLSHHIALIYGVKHAPSVTALEFVSFSKLIFTIIFSFLFFKKEPTKNGVLGALIIGITLILFNRKLREKKKEIENKEEIIKK